MNLVLFEKDEPGVLLRVSDPRAQHVIRILRLREGDSFDCGVINGRKGKACIVSCTAEIMKLELMLTEDPSPLHPVTLVIGLTRPQTAKKILREATSLGVSRIVFAATSKSEPAYCLSSLWERGDYLRYLLEGASQAFSTLLPSVEARKDLGTLILGESDCNRLACDNYEATVGLSTCEYEYPKTLLAIGPERGWTNRERDILRDSGCTLVSLGKRILRSETACVTALSLALAGMGLI
jgi:16S rRNA (uracil1498-N3)-methyltransferase